MKQAINSRIAVTKRSARPSTPIAIAMLAAAWGLLGGTPACAQAASTDKTHVAYEAAMKCFVANGRATGMKQRAGDVDGAARYEASGRVAFDTALRLGRVLGYSNQRLDHDFSAVQLRELPLMVSDAAYFREVVTMCRSLGLMPNS